MPVSGDEAGWRQAPVDALVAFCFGDALPLSGALGRWDWTLCGALTEAVATGRFGGQLGEQLLMPTQPPIVAPRLFVCGLGARGATQSPSGGERRAVAQKAQTMLLQAGCRSVVIALPETGAAPDSPSALLAPRWASELRAFWREQKTLRVPLILPGAA